MTETKPAGLFAQVKDVMSPLVAFTALAYLSGWLYRSSYFATFGVPSQSEKLHEYLFSSWAILVLDALVIAVLSLFVLRGSPLNLVLKPLISFAAFVVFLLATLWFGYRAVVAQSRYETYRSFLWAGLAFSIALVAIAMRESKPKPDASKASIRQVQIVRMILLAIAVLAFIMSALAAAVVMGVHDAHRHIALQDAQCAIPGWPLPEIIVQTDVRLPPSVFPTVQPNNDCPCTYDGLRLITANDKAIYIFAPDRTVNGVPAVYMINTSHILNYQVRPIWLVPTFSSPLTTPISTSSSKP